MKRHCSLGGSEEDQTLDFSMKFIRLIRNSIGGFSPQLGIYNYKYTYLNLIFLSVLGNCVCVSSWGVDEPGCLNHTSQSACRTIGYPINNGFNAVCVSGKMNNMSENIEIICNDNKPNEVSIYCQECVIENSDYSFSCVRINQCNATFNNINIIGCDVNLSNIHVKFVYSNAEDIFIKDSTNQNRDNFISFQNSNFTCLRDTSGCGIRMNATTVGKIDIVKSEFSDLNLYIDISQLMLTFSESIFIRPMIDINVRSPEYLKIPALVTFHKVVTKNGHTFYKSDKIPRIK